MAWKAVISAIAVIALVTTGAIFFFIIFPPSNSKEPHTNVFHVCDQSDNFGVNSTGRSQNPVVLVRGATNPVTLTMCFGFSDSSQQTYMISVSSGANGTKYDPEPEIIATFNQSSVTVPPSPSDNPAVERFKLYLRATNDAKQGNTTIGVQGANPSVGEIGTALNIKVE